MSFSKYFTKVDGTVLMTLPPGGSKVEVFDINEHKYRHVAYGVVAVDGKSLNITKALMAHFTRGEYPVDGLWFRVVEKATEKELEILKVKKEEDDEFEKAVQAARKKKEEKRSAKAL